MNAEQIAALVERNDDSARRELFETYYGRTYAVALSILRRRESAEDITQDAFIRAFQNLGQLNDKARFPAWLTVIASNLARNYLKREKRIILSDQVPEEKSGDETTETEALRNLNREAILHTLRQLPPEQRQVVLLYYYDDLKVEDVAAMLKISPGTVKSRLYRAREKLSRLLEP